jgi:predicted DNA-binding protein (MmcQ/YjbR family)
MNVDQLREYCLKLKGTTEDIKWGHDLCFSIGSKMYCVTGADGEGGTSFKCSDEDFVSLQERDGIIPAPYMARNKWVMVEKSSALTKQEWRQYILQSYKMIGSKLTKKVKAEVGFED